MEQELYIVIETEHLGRLEYQVNQKILEDYSPVGSITISKNSHGNFYYQAMIHNSLK